MKTKYLQQIYRLLAISLLASFATACAVNPSAPPVSSKPTPSNSESDLAAMKWQLASIAQKGQSGMTTLNAGLAANRYQFTFKQGRISVTGGCNILSGVYRLSNNNGLVLGPMGSTKRACERSRMLADNEILSYLSGVTNYALNGQTLTLSTAFGQRLVLTGTATAETQFGSAGVRKFIEIQNSSQGLVWREVKYNSSWVRIKDNAKWETVYPGIQGFVPENNRQYIVRIFEYTDQQTQQPVWVKDMITMNGML